MFNGLPLGYRLRRRWEWSRPFPLPSYTKGTPAIRGSGDLKVFLPPNPSTLGAAAQQATPMVEAVLAKMTQNDTTVAVRAYYRTAREKFGDAWRYADLPSMLWAAATLSPPVSYLEIGVRSGRSVCVVGAAAPACDVYGFDLWTPEYAGAENLGPDFVRGELKAVGHTGGVTLVAGDSRQTVPAFLREHPDLYFDLIAIDGGKSTSIVSSDYVNALPRLKVGGVLVSDDMNLAPHLRRIWQTMIRDDARYVTWEFAEGTVGVSAAVRMADEPVLPSLFQPE